jgi:hypothetical protein
LRLQLEHFFAGFASVGGLGFFGAWLFFSSSFGFSSPKEDKVKSTTMSSTDFFLLFGGMPAAVKEMRGNIYSKLQQSRQILKNAEAFPRKIVVTLLGGYVTLFYGKIYQEKKILCTDRVANRLL